VLYVRLLSRLWLTVLKAVGKVWFVEAACRLLKMDGLVLWEVVETERMKFKQGMRLIRVSTRSVVQTREVRLTAGSSTRHLEAFHSASVTLLPLQPSARRIQPDGHAFKNAGRNTVIAQSSIPLPTKVLLWSPPRRPTTLPTVNSLATLEKTLSGSRVFSKFVLFLSAERWNGGACTRTRKSLRTSTGPIETSPGSNDRGRCPTSTSSMRAPR